MIRSLVIAGLFAAAASVALADGAIGTAERGPYVCEMPGDAGIGAAIPRPERNFKIETFSTYASPQGNGTYLRRGDRVVMTSGPRKGEQYLILSDGFLRLIGADGRAGRLRCVLQR